ncbi:MAG: hypothetical protein NVSMB51_01160 [Solirubrobacteraceae bacterium]
MVHDGLTGVLNRSGFEHSVKAVLGKPLPEQGCMGLLFVDLDGFKQINDEHGHQVGDELLCEVAARLRRTLRGKDTVARLGGDEFAIILLGARQAGEVTAAAVRVHAAFAEPFEIAGITAAVSVSVGEARAPEHGTTIDDLVKQADRVMYSRKGHHPRALTL